MQKYYRFEKKGQETLTHHSLLCDATDRGQLRAFHQIQSCYFRKTALPGIGIPYQFLEFEFGHLDGSRCVSVYAKGVCCFRTLVELKQYFREHERLYADLYAVEVRGRCVASYSEKCGGICCVVQPDWVLKMRSSVAEIMAE